MANIRVLNNVSLYNSITAASGVRTPQIDGFNSKLTIKPDPSLNDDRYLIIEPTSPSDIHIRAGGLSDQSTASLKLGGEYTHVEVSDLASYIAFKTGLSAEGEWKNWETMNAGQPWWVGTEQIVLPGGGFEYRNALALPNNSHIYGGNTVDESGQITWHGSLSVTGNITVAGSAIFHNTEYTTTSAIIITNTGTGPALVVNQTGEQAVAAFYDDNSIAFYIDGKSATAGNVGIGTSTPNENLTVVGNISATGVIYATGMLSKFVSAFGNGVDTSFAINHNLGVRDVVVSVVDNITQEVVYPSVTYTAMNQITLEFSEAPALTAYKAIVIG